jgi:hypothetical protein
MSGYEPDSTSPNDDDANDHFTGTPEQIASFSQRYQRMAEMVATGDLPLPQHLTDEQLAMLVREVQQRRRRRLVQFIARAIATHIVHGREPRQGGQAHDA